MNRNLDERKLFGRLTILQPLGVTRHYPKKSTIIFQGEEPHSVLIIRSGIVKVYGITSDGDQRTVTILNAGDVFPTSWVFGKTEVCIYYYEASSDCSILSVTKKDFMETLQKYPELKEQVFQTYMSHYIASTMHVYALEHSYARDKLIYILLYLATRFGYKEPSGKTRISLRLSHQDIAEMVGITRETAAVELHKLRQKGYIEYERFTYYVDVARLQKLKGDEDIAITI
jgi:CRP/FNR family transcriptional regulator